jgi:hypothetical protein
MGAAPLAAEYRSRPPSQADENRSDEMADQPYVAIAAHKSSAENLKTISEALDAGARGS